MKIYVLPVPPELQPEATGFEYPPGNLDYGVEQDFVRYIERHGLAASSPDDASWHYLPVFWTRWHLNHDYARVGLSELQQRVGEVLIDDTRTFTVCQYDDGPLVDLGRATLFLASRKGPEGFDIPLLRNALKRPRTPVRKHHLASFIGRLATNPLRVEMARALEGRSDVLIRDGNFGQTTFVRETLRSRLSLCPRGYGGSSFRFFESMQLGVPPLLLADRDTRPFKNFVSWSEVSFFVETTDALAALLDQADQHQLREMGKKAAILYEELKFGRWGKFVMQELNDVVSPSPGVARGSEA